MITRAEWHTIPLEGRLVEHATHSDDELLREDLIAAVKKIDSMTQRILDLNAEITRLERVASSVSPY